MEFGIEKCAVVIMKNRQRQITEWNGLRNQENIGTLGEQGKLQVLVDIFTSGQENYWRCPRPNIREIRKTDDVFNKIKKGIPSIEVSVNPSMRGLEDSFKKSKESLVVSANNSRDKMRTNLTTKTRKSKWKGMVRGTFNKIPDFCTGI